MRGLVVAIAMLASAATPPSLGHAAAPTDQDIVDSYQYMLSRWLVLRQESLDLEEGFKWNEIIHRKPGGVTWANPNLDVAYSEAWIAVDESSCTLINLPEIKGRYYTVQVLNGWGEVTTNINERNFPDHPFGNFALCLKGADVALPEGVQRIDLPNKKSRILLRVELGPNPDEAIALQNQITMKATGSPTVEGPVVKFDFPIAELPGVRPSTRRQKFLRASPTSMRAWRRCRTRHSPLAKRLRILINAPMSTRSFAPKPYRPLWPLFQKWARWPTAGCIHV